LTTAFRKISSVRTLTGGTRWYLSGDCLLSAKRMMYSVEYRRFYLHDLESIVVWPSRLWQWRIIIPAATLLLIGGSFWKWVDPTAGEIFCALGLAWMGLELALGPTAEARIRTTGATVDLRLVNRTRRARKVLAKIDAAVRAARGISAQPIVSANSTQSPEPSIQPAPAIPPLTATIAGTAQTNGS